MSGLTAPYWTIRQSRTRILCTNFVVQCTRHCTALVLWNTPPSQWLHMLLRGQQVSVLRIFIPVCCCTIRLVYSLLWLDKSRFNLWSVSIAKQGKGLHHLFFCEWLSCVFGHFSVMNRPFLCVLNVTIQIVRWRQNDLDVGGKLPIHPAWRKRVIILDRFLVEIYFGLTSWTSQDIL